MAEISNEMLLEEAMKVQAIVENVEQQMSGTLTLLRQMNAELAEGQRKNDAARCRYEMGRSSH